MCFDYSMLLGAAHLISRGGGGGGYVFYWESDNFVVFI